VLNDFTLPDQINTGLLLITALGVVAAVVQIRNGTKAQRATFLKDLYLQFRIDPEIAESFYLIEYDKFRYDSSFHGSEIEPKIDRLLTFIDLVCELYDQQSISQKEMKFFNYPFKRVAQDPEIQKYLEFLGKFYARNSVQHKPFSAFQNYARKNLSN
jgi:hypothetical protein